MKINALQNLRSRRDPEGILMKEAYARLQEDDAVIYLVGAMEPVDDKYTQKTFSEGERVRNQLEKGLAAHSLTADYEYQGSVTKHTHIRAHSDIDLLTLDARSIALQPPQVPTSPYKGDPVQDLLQLRSLSTSILRSAFPQATVDTNGAKSIKINGGSLARTVDVVAGNWYDTNDYTRTGNKCFRGVMILEARIPSREEDQPFLHTALINHKDGETMGNTRKLIRLLKSLKYDSEGKVTMSSFDIESIVYQMDKTRMQFSRGMEIPLATAALHWLTTIENDQLLRDSLQVPDGKRKIFATGKATLQQLKDLRMELATLLSEVEKGLSRSFRKLAEARIKWPDVDVSQFRMYS